MNNLVKVSRASSKNNEGVTIRTSNLSDTFRYDFNIGGDNRLAILKLKNGTRLVGQYSRDGQTIYVPFKSVPRGFGKLPKVGRPVFVDIVEVEEL